MGALLFRSGRADEPFPSMGISHLVEHLALFGIGRQAYSHNGFVDHQRTVFHAVGNDAELVDFFGQVTRGLHALPLERAADEARILRTEAMRASPGLPDLHFWYRYGAKGLGTMGLVEYGLGSIDAARLTAWVAERFTAGNAVAWFAGPPPEGLRFHLPPGPRIPPVQPTPIEPLGLPAWMHLNLPGVGLGLVVPRRSDMAMALRIVTLRLEQRLRYDLGKSYEVSQNYTPLNHELAHASLFASCLESEMLAVRSDFTAVLAAFATTGPTPDELAKDVDGFRRSAADPDSHLGELDRAAYNDLLGHPQDSRQELLEEMSAVTVESARDALAAALRTGILLAPISSPLEPSPLFDWKPYPTWSVAAVTGKRFDRADRNLPWKPRVEQLIVGDEGVSWLDANEHPSTVLYRNCVGMLKDPAGYRVLYGADGFTVRVAARYWRNGLDAVDRIDFAVPASVVVPFDLA